MWLEMLRPVAAYIKATNRSRPSREKISPDGLIAVEAALVSEEPAIALMATLSHLGAAARDDAVSLYCLGLGHLQGWSGLVDDLTAVECFEGASSQVG